MRRSRPVRIGELWSGFVNDNPTVSHNLLEAKIPELWSKIVGDAVASLTTSIEVKNHIMYVYMSSSVARHEMFMRREELKNKINTELGATIVRSIIVK